MKSFNLIDKSLLGCFIILLIALFSFNPQEVKASTECPGYCQELCGTDNGEACQYTFCPGSTGKLGVICNGIWQG